MRIIKALLVAHLLATSSPAVADFSPRIKDTVQLDFGLTAGAMTAWGISRWGWFQHSPKVQREGWFADDTHAGGADKTGHFFMSYVLADVLNWDFRRNGVKNPERAAALTAMAAMTLLEVGDATSSKYGFSTEDLVADAGGVLASWFLATHPKWDDLIDIRMEYWPSAGFDLGKDATSDYSGMRHLLAFKSSAVPALSATPLRWLELQAGYYTRGFRTYDDMALQANPERHLYVGVGLSFPALFKTKPVARTIFSYIQPPNFNLSTSYKF